MKIIDANTVFGVWPKEEIDISISKLLGVIEENNIEKVLSLSMKGVFYDYEQGNDETLMVSRKYPQIIPVATCDLRKYYGDGKFVKNLIDQGFKAIRLFPDFQGWPIAYEPFKVILEELKENPLPLLISVTDMGSITALADLCGYSNFPIIIVGVGYPLYAEALSTLKKRKNFYLDTSHMDTPDGLEIFARELGADRIVFGSYSPIQYFRPSLLYLQKSDLTEEEKTLIALGNIKRILKL